MKRQRKEKGEVLREKCCQGASGSWGANTSSNRTLAKPGWHTGTQSHADPELESNWDGKDGEGR